MKRFAFLLAFMLLAPAAHGQTAADARWNQWLGCWELVTERARAGIPSTTRSDGTRSVTDPDNRPRVCVETSGGGATFRTIVGTQTPIEQTIVADGTERAVVDQDCRGSQRAEWSGDGRRLFARSALTCTSDKGPRNVSGIALLATDGTWVDIQSINVAGVDTVRIRRYRRAAGSGRAPANIDLTPLTLNDIKEASGKVATPALEAALIETKAGFDLTGKQLLDLDRSGVPDSVVDLIVALSYPDRFVVERTSRTDSASGFPLSDLYLVGWSFGYPYWSDYCYGSYSPYFYTPFAYRYAVGCPYSYYYPNSYLDGGSGGGGGSAGDRPTGAGRVVDGHGYTRVRTREAESAAATSARGSSAGGGSTSTSSSGSSGSSSGSGGVSSQGFSSGGGGGDGGGRTAVPR